MIIYSECFRQGYNGIVDLESSGARVMMDVGVLKQIKERQREQDWTAL
ncbi:MAG TPA: hypothetical protein VN381_03170 [Anaerovoracaceae bacterium]|nr:hypothetical protein [Anaerovoracaceae bacterium]